MRLQLLLSLVVGALVTSGCATAATGQRQTTIRAGQTVLGTLDPSDLRASDDSYFDYWTFSGAPGERVGITMRSDEFDAFLSWSVVGGADFEEVDSDDDGGGGTDSRLAVIVPASGTFVIRANSLSAGETGAYTLSAERLPDPVTTPSGPGFGGTTGMGGIQAGQTVSGSLTDSDLMLPDGSFYDVWTYTGAAGERLRVTMRSDDFDTFLSWGEMVDGNYNSIESDDDGGGGTDSQLEVTLPSSGRFVIQANSLSEGETGTYTLSVERLTGG